MMSKLGLSLALFVPFMMGQTVAAWASCCTCGYTEFQVVDPIKAPDLQVSKFCNTAAGHLSAVQFRNMGKPAISFVWSSALGKKKSEQLGRVMWTGKKEVVTGWVGTCGCNGSTPVFDINIESVAVEKAPVASDANATLPANGLLVR